MGSTHKYQQEIMRTVRGEEVSIFGNGYEYSPDIGIFGMFEEVWAETMDGQPFELTEAEEEQFGFELAEAHESDGYWD